MTKPLHSIQLDADGGLTVAIPEGVDPNDLQIIIASCLHDSTEWFPGVADDMGHNILALNGEAGELANLWKKVERGSLPHPLDDEEVKLAIAEEAIDVLIYLSCILGLLGVNAGIMYWAKQNHNEGRFGNGSSDDQSDPASGIQSN